MLNRIFSRFDARLAIDLGTANTLVSSPEEGLLVDEPSVVAVERKTRRVLSDGAAVGHLARQMLGRTPQSISVERPMRAGVVADFKLCEAMLRYFLRKARRNGWSLRPVALVAAPLCATAVEKRALLASVQRAGARQAFIISEAKAAAVGAGLPVVEPHASMICDIGGGTTEASVVSLGDIVSAASIRTAGDAMDQAIADYMRRHFSLKIAPAEAERLKIEIGSAYPLGEEMVEQASGVDVVSRLPRRATVASEQIRAALAEPLEKIIDALKQTLDGCDAQMAADLVDQGLTLCGGGALLRSIDRFVEEQTGLPARIAPNPMTTVADGVRICLEQFDQWRSSMESSDDNV